MFKAGSSLDGMTKEEILYQDFKKFNYNEHNVGVGQVFTTDIDFVLNNKDEYIQMLDDASVNDDYKIICLFITDIINNGSYMLYNTKAEDILKESYELDEIYEGCYIENIVSRKKQIIPPILENLEKYF